MNRQLSSFLIVTLLLLCACKSTQEREVTESWSPSQVKVVVYFVESDDGRWKTKEEKYYVDGTQEYFGSFDKAGNRDGDWKYFYPTGQLWSLGSYKNGLKHGKKEVYWPDGMKRYEGQYADDKKSGSWIFYNKDGSILQKKDFSTKENPSEANH